MIEGGELLPFVRDMYEREGEGMAWDYYLSKVQGVSFADFKGGLADAAPPAPAMGSEQIVRQTLEITGLEARTR